MTLELHRHRCPSHAADYTCERYACTGGPVLECLACERQWRGISSMAKGWRAKFSDDEVRAIRAERERGDRLSVISARHGVSDGLISRIANRKAYGWVK